VLIHKITNDRRAGEYQLHIKKVLGQATAEAEKVNFLLAPLPAFRYFVSP